MAESQDVQPVFLLAPYLPLRRQHDVGPWSLVPADTEEIQWVQPRLREHVEAFLRHFVDVHGQVIQHPTLVHRRSLPVGAREPTPEEFSALQRAVTFVALDSSVEYSKETARSTWLVATSDNTEIQGWRASLDGFYSVVLGAIVRSYVGGLNVNDENARVPPASELHLPEPLDFDEVLATALYDCLMRDDGDAHVLANVIRWLDKAWRNTTSIDEWDRLVFLRTAFEALVGTNGRFEGARRLRESFEEWGGVLGIEQPGDRLLWTPIERTTRFQWTSNGTEKAEDRSDLQTWYIALSDMRNTIVHDSARPYPEYQGGTAYDGHLLHVAKRVLCDAVKLKVSVLTSTKAWMPARDRMLEEVVARYLGEPEQGF